MSITDLVSYVTVGEAAEDPEKFEALEISFEQSFQDLADGFFTGVTQNISEALEFAAGNPLCVVLVSCLLVVITFHLIPAVFNVFGRRL